MDYDDFVEPEVGVAVAVTAAVCSPPVRRTLRRGVVLGLAGLMMVGDAVADFGRGVTKGANSVRGKLAEGAVEAEEKAEESKS